MIHRLFISLFFSFISLFSFSSHALNSLVPLLRLSSYQWEYKTGSNGEFRTLRIPLRKNDGGNVSSLQPAVLNQIKSELKFRVCLGTASSDQVSPCRTRPHLLRDNFDLYYLNGQLQVVVILEPISETDLFYIGMWSNDNGTEGYLSSTKTITYQFIGDLEILRLKLRFPPNPETGYEIVGTDMPATPEVLGTALLGVDLLGAERWGRVKDHLIIKLCDAGWRCVNDSDRCLVGDEYGVVCPFRRANYDEHGFFVLMNIGSPRLTTNPDAWAGVQYEKWEVTHSPILPLPRPIAEPAPEPDAATIAGGVQINPNILNNTNNTVLGQLANQTNINNLAGIIPSNPEVPGGGEPPDNPVNPPVVDPGAAPPVDPVGGGETPNEIVPGSPVGESGGSSCALSPSSSLDFSYILFAVLLIFFSSMHTTFSSNRR